ncbi:hypothetical protein GCM10010405_05630 [Streptomyces macrosporus]|uniref:Uncharacterized protein n=1 Tax=Streptomyces macrosporus TaxID=44032 RepID=A0ABN3JCT9_9ACTN
MAEEVSAQGIARARRFTRHGMSRFGCDVRTRRGIPAWAPRRMCSSRLFAAEAGGVPPTRRGGQAALRRLSPSAFREADRVRRDPHGSPGNGCQTRAERLAVPVSRRTGPTARKVPVVTTTS